MKKITFKGTEVIYLNVTHIRDHLFKKFLSLNYLYKFKVFSGGLCKYKISFIHEFFSCDSKTTRPIETENYETEFPICMQVMVYKCECYSIDYH